MSNEYEQEKKNTKNLITRLHHVLIMFILKYCSDYEHPLNPPAVVERLSVLTGTPHDVKTVTRCLDDLYQLTAIDNLPLDVCENLEKIYALTFGGYICISEKKKMDIISSLILCLLHIPLCLGPKHFCIDSVLLH